MSSISMYNHKPKASPAWRPTLGGLFVGSIVTFVTSASAAAASGLPQVVDCFLTPDLCHRFVPVWLKFPRETSTVCGSGLHVQCLRRRPASLQANPCRSKVEWPIHTHPTSVYLNSERNGLSVPNLSPRGNASSSLTTPFESRNQGSVQEVLGVMAMLLL